MNTVVILCVRWDRGEGAAGGGEEELEDQDLEELEEQIGHRDRRKKGKGSTFFYWLSWYGAQVGL